MSLHGYKEKRRLQNTPEPAGGKPTGKKLQFVIQKHAASHLHYDFRLEIRGILKSWAVPKGPSMDPSTHRLAMLVEDHPYDYKDFEGIIPKGNYGAGTVIIWDQGTYETVEKEPDKATQEKLMLKQFYGGSIKIILHGKKLKGAFSLVKIPARGENSWLLTKVKDKYATKQDITAKDRSVISDETIESLSKATGARKWISNRSSDGALKKKNNNVGIKEGIKSPMPTSIAPMLATLTRDPLNDPDYLYEIKWDGYRIIAYANGKKVELHSRSALDYTSKYPPVAQALKELKHKVILDGEVVVFNEEGKPDFDKLQNYNGHNTPITYYAFDLLWQDGYSLLHLPLIKRKEILKQLLEGNDILRYSESFDDGPALYEEMLKLNMEGIVAKKKDSEYQPGIRGNDWLKTPTRKRQEFVIGGWAESDRGRSFRSLLFGAYNNGRFEWIGRSGGGYKEREMAGILKELKKREIEDSPFVNKVLDTKGAKIHWTKPELVANFEFAAWTKTGRIRKPATFLGFRKDKKPTQVVREVPRDTELIEEEIHEEEEIEKHPGKKITSKDSNWKVLEKVKPESREEIKLDDCTVALTDVDRSIWKGIPKARLIEYYHSVAKVMLPHLKDRPQSLHIKPNGAAAPGLYIKDMEGREPECAEIYSDRRRHPKAGKRSQIDYLVCNNEATLLYMINLGCIDINPWMSRVQNPEQPDFINIDLDPSAADFKKVIETALAAKQILKKHSLTSFIKTSGKTGIHIYIPVTDIDFPQARNFSEQLGKEIQALVPEISTTNVSINQRGDKVFIDPSQNDYADTLAAAYSARSHHLPTVSTPLEWKEIKSGLNPEAFTIDSILARITKKGDLFADVLDNRIQVKNYKALQKL
jgi:bifunctional non-homologous end joining protein LigD